MSESTKIPKTVKPKKVKRLFLKWFFIKSALIVCLILALAGGGYYAYRAWLKCTEQKFQAFSSLVSGEIVNCAELTAVKYNYSEVVSLKKSALMGLAKSYSIVRFSGTVRAGISNLENAVIDISSDKKQVSVILPPARIISNDIISQEVFDEIKNIFVPIHAREIFSEIDNARERKLAFLLETGFLSEAQTRGEQLITRILSAMGFVDIRVISR